MQSHNTNVGLAETCLCCSADVVGVWELPELPLTGIYLDYNLAPNYEYLHNQLLAFCKTCGHMQLTNRLDPTLLYRQTYTHLTSSSPISQSGNKYLLDVILKNFSRKKQILEVGCNDLYLLRQLKEIAEHRAGIDPIYEDEQKEISHGIHVKGGFMERINLGDLIKSPIDLLISAHTFEHLANPIQAVINLAPYLSSNCDIIIEVPSSIRMIAQLRLDQVFHQHINYYSPKSLSALLKPLNFKLKNVSHNFSYWGGTQILHFTNVDSFDSVNAVELKLEDFRRAQTLFLEELLAVKFKIENAPGNVYAYGAAQMLPILQYHLGDTFDDVVAILDDNPTRIGKFFPGDNRKIQSFKEFRFEPQDTVVITALDSAKPLSQNLIAKGVQLIILPIGNI